MLVSSGGPEKSGFTLPGQLERASLKNEES